MIKELVCSYHLVAKVSMKTRQMLVVFPLLLTLVAPSVSFRTDFPSRDAETLGANVPIISKDYFPAFKDSCLVSPKPKSRVSLWHKNLYMMQFLPWSHRPGAYAYSTNIVLPSAIPLVISTTVMRC